MGQLHAKAEGLFPVLSTAFNWHSRSVRITEGPTISVEWVMNSSETGKRAAGMWQGLWNWIRKTSKPRTTLKDSAIPSQTNLVSKRTRKD